MRIPRALPALLILLPLALAPLAAGHHEPASVRYVTGADMNGSLYVGGLLCADVRSGEPAPTVTVNGRTGCVLSAPLADEITLAATGPLGDHHSFSFVGLTDDLTPCGIGGPTSSPQTLARPEACTHFGFFPTVGNTYGTLSVG
jgi:hypothetical protein